MEASSFLFRNIAIAISVILLATYAVSRMAFPKMFSTVYDFSKLLNFKLKDEFGSNMRLLSTESLYFTIILSASTSFVLMILTYGLKQMGRLDSFDMLIPTSFGEGLLIWLVLTLIIQLIFLLKYLFIWAVGVLFNLPVGMSRHFQEVQSLNNCFILTLTIACSLVIYSNYGLPELMIEAIITGALIYLLYRLLNIFIKLEQLKVYSKLYIFSYLCTTEIVPALVGIRLMT